MTLKEVPLGLKPRICKLNTGLRSLEAKAGSKTLISCCIIVDWFEKRGHVRQFCSCKLALRFCHLSISLHV